MKKLSLALVFAAGVAQADPSCAFRIGYTAKDAAETSKVYRPEDIENAKDCEDRARSHCGLQMEPEISQTIRWTFSEEADVSLWTLLNCGDSKPSSKR